MKKRVWIHLIKRKGYYFDPEANATIYHKTQKVIRFGLDKMTIAELKVERPEWGYLIQKQPLFLGTKIIHVPDFFDTQYFNEWQEAYQYFLLVNTYAQVQFINELKAKHPIGNTKAMIANVQPSQALF